AHPAKKENTQKIVPDKHSSFLMKPLPLYLTLLLIVPLFTLGYLAHQPKRANKDNTPLIPQSSNIQNACATIIREKDSSLIRPLLFVDVNDESIFIPVKKKIIDFIEQKKRAGVITTASVYLNDINTACHIEVNPDELYDPASIMKVSMMISYLKEAESNPALLKKRYLYEGNVNLTTTATIKDKTLEKGKSYTVEELLRCMIAYSDNEAFSLLARNIGKQTFRLLNEDFDIPMVTDNNNGPDHRPNFIANINSVSRFFRVLYNASYLDRTMSQYALKLLTQSTYKDGLLKGIDPSVKVAHKFGERMENGIAELHEFGIVYMKDRPYLLGVMTKGKDLKQLPEILSGISKITYDELKAK
ncbi:MAG: serine hydrolase, partial [Bacteroidota bacterium]